MRRTREEKGNKPRRTKILSYYPTVICIVIFLIVSAAFWVYATQQASGNTMNDMGEFYLEEIAQRNTITIVSELTRRKDLMKKAVSDLMEQSPQSMEEVQEYAMRVQQSNDLDMIALVDEEGAVYTAHGIYPELETFGLKLEDIANEEVCHIDVHDSNSLIVISVPVDVMMADRIHFVAYVTGMNADKVILKELIQNEETKAVCGLYSSEGVNLMPGAGSRLREQDFFKALEKNSSLEETGELQKLQQDWQQGNSGYLVFDNGLPGNFRSFLYYMPVSGTDWYVIAMMRDSVLTKAMEKGFHRIVMSCLGFLGAVILATIFLVALGIRQVVQTNRQKRENSLMRIIGALSNDYSDIFLICLKDDTSLLIKARNQVVLPQNRVLRKCHDTWRAYVEKWVMEEDRQMVMDAVETQNLRLQLQNKPDFTVEYRLKYGAEIHYYMAKFVLTGEDEEHVIVGFRCIDERMQAEQVRRREILDALDIAREANRAKTSFLFNMSHDIRTPMNAIIGYTNLLEKHLDDKKLTRQYVGKIKTANDFLLSLINNVLEMARIESGKATLDESYWSLEEFDATLISLFDQQMKEKGILFRREYDVQHHGILCDTIKVREIFVNIIGNAVKYTPGGGTITVSLKELPGENEKSGLFQTTVSDTGIGMSEEFLPHLFDEFSREKTSTDSKIIGTGLGMPIVKKLVELMQGTIEVESTFGKGTSITVTLPHRLAEKADLNRMLHHTRDYEHADFAGRRILLAEDNEMNAEIAATILTEAGFEVDRATDGIICIDMLERASEGYYDLILMDVQMPNMDGYKATRVIRRMKNVVKSRIPIIAMTANAFEEDKMNAFNAGMNGHLAKPISVPRLMSTLESFLKEDDSAID